MAFFMNSRQKRAVKYAEDGRCNFAQATLRDEFKWLRRNNVSNPLEDRGYRKAHTKVKDRCGTALGSLGQRRRAR